MAYRIMMRMETGEVVRAPAYNGGDDDFGDIEMASQWITDNEDQFPESSFWVESIGGFRRAPEFDDDSEENWE